MVTINFRGDAGVQSGNAMDFTQDGVTVTVTAGARAKTDEYGIGSRIRQGTTGLGNLTDYSYDRANPACQTFPAFCDSGLIDPMVTTEATDGNWGVSSAGSLSGPGVWEYLALDFHGLE